MIQVSHLTRQFPGCVAVDDVSFEVGRGEIVGFLGPNGAGKTTTMRILACYLPATGGAVSVAGYDVFKDSIEVRKRIGYMPENVPLYPEMRVDEYLNYRAQLKGVPSNKRRKRVDGIKDLCGLKDDGRRIIGQLSKGFRQRVGLAESMIHDPDLLILDEPTIGLDPNQIRQIRELIKSLASRHTILISTHILPEVEMTCQRVLIIHRGRIVASDTTEQLRRMMMGGARIVAEILGPQNDILQQLQSLPGAQCVTASDAGGWGCFTLECAKGADLRPDIFNLSAARRWTLRELRMEEKSLEDIFVSLTRGDPEGEPL